jgi:hypothetical protein
MRDDDDLLDADDLDGVVGSPQPRTLDVLVAGDDVPGLSDRGRAWWQDKALAFAGRHRVGLVSACAVVLLVAGLVTYWHQRPPAVDPVVRVAFTSDPVPPDRDVLGLQNLYRPAGLDTAAADYQVGVQVPGEVVDVVGISGPGLKPSTVSAGHALYGYQPTVTLAATFDCSQKGWWTAEAGDFVVKLTRTDAYSRVLDAAVTMAAPDAAAWRQAVQRYCLGPILAAAFADWDVSVQHAHSRVSLSFRVRNPSSHAFYLQVAFPKGPAPDEPPVIQVPPGGSSLLTTSWQTSDCSSYPSNLMALLGPTDSTDVILLRAGVARFGPPDPQLRYDLYSDGVRIPHDLRVHLQAELDQACAASGHQR